MPAYKPASYTSVSPYLVVEDVARIIEFLVSALDAVELRRFTGQDGRIHHAEVRIDDSVVMLGEASAGWPPSPAHVHVYVSDVDKAYARALAVGATSVQAPVKKNDPDKRCGVKDVGGTTWWLSTMLE